FLSWICSRTEQRFLPPGCASNGCWYEAYLVSFGARQRLAACDSSPGGCRKPGLNAATRRKACGDQTYRQKSSARPAGELQCLGDMPWGKPGDCMWPDNRHVGNGDGNVNIADGFPVSFPRTLMLLRRACLAADTLTSCKGDFL